MVPSWRAADKDKGASRQSSGFPHHPAVECKRRYFQRRFLHLKGIPKINCRSPKQHCGGHENLTSKGFLTRVEHVSERPSRSRSHVSCRYDSAPNKITRSASTLLQGKTVAEGHCRVWVYGLPRPRCARGGGEANEPVQGI